MKRAKFPERVKRGSCVVTIYRTPTKGQDAYTVAYYDFTGRLKRQMLSDYADAKQSAISTAESLAAGNGECLVLTGPDLFVYKRAKEALQPLNTLLDTAMHEYRKALADLAGVPLPEAIRFYLENRPPIGTKSCKDVLDEMIEVKMKKGRSELTIKDVRYRLTAFVNRFQCPIHTVTAAQIDAYLGAMKWSGRTKNNHRRLIGMLFHFAKLRGYVPAHHLGVNAVERVTEEKKEVEVFSPKQVAKMLHEANPQLRLAMAIMAFAAVRHSEVQRLDWSDINFDDGHIVLGAANTKTRMRRLTPIPDNLRLWLQPHVKKYGRVAPYKNLCEPMVRVAKRARVPWVRNGLRHSAISYLVALKENVELVALECGTSTSMVFRHYRRVVTKQQAEAWFRVVPEED